MFCSHLSIIKLNRNEPSGLNIEKESAKIQRLFARMAESIVVRNILAAPKDPKELARTKARMKRQAEFDERLKMSKNFLELWDKWRDFYFSLPPYTPKLASQLTAIESAIKFCEEFEMDLNMMIGCLHRSFLKRSFKPGFSHLYDEKALEVYDNFYDLVIADLDRQEREETSLRGTK